MSPAIYIAVDELAPFNSLRGQEQRTILLDAQWFCCPWSQAYWPPDTHSANPTTNLTSFQALRTQLGLSLTTKVP